MKKYNFVPSRLPVEIISRNGKIYNKDWQEEYEFKIIINFICFIFICRSYL